MAGNQTTNIERPPRSTAWSGVVVVLAAIFGIDSAVVGQAAAHRHHKIGSVAIRAAVPQSASSRAMTAATLAAAAGALAMLLLFGRQTLDVARKALVVEGAPSETNRGVLFPQRFRTSISYHLGGLYGP